MDFSLREIPNVRQRPEEGFRRYFDCPLFRLWVFYTKDKSSIEGFQLFIGTNPEQRELAIIWSLSGDKFIYQEVEPHDERGFMGMSPIFGKTLQHIPPITVSFFRQDAQNIDQELVRFITTKIMEKGNITEKMVEDAERKYKER